MKRSTVRVKRIGIVVEEALDIRFSLTDADKKLFERNPERVVGRLLKEAGFRVRGVSIADRPRLIDLVVNGKVGHCVPKWFHVLIPEEEKSNWIEVCM